MPATGSQQLYVPLATAGHRTWQSALLAQGGQLGAVLPLLPEEPEEPEKPEELVELATPELVELPELVMPPELVTPPEEAELLGPDEAPVAQHDRMLVRRVATNGSAYVLGVSLLADGPGAGAPPCASITDLAARTGLIARTLRERRLFIRAAGDDARRLPVGGRMIADGLERGVQQAADQRLAGAEWADPF